MTFDERQEIISEINPDALFADGFEDALVGYVEIFNKLVAAYDRDKCIDILMIRDGMSSEEAVEYFDFNVTGSYVGENTPAFITTLE